MRIAPPQGGAAGVPPPQDLTETVARALAEDIGAGDLTAELIPQTAGCSKPQEIRCGSRIKRPEFISLNRKHTINRLQFLRLTTAHLCRKAIKNIMITVYFFSTNFAEVLGILSI